MKNGEIFWVDDALPYNIMNILVDKDFGEGSMELELDPQDDSDDENTDDQICNSILVYIMFLHN